MNHRAILAFVAVALCACSDDAGSAVPHAQDCSGTDPENFCDDCNPCTADANCTSCDDIPPPHTIYNCTPYEKLPEFCKGVQSGCWHKVLTDSVDNSCFPVQGSGMTEDLHSGRCCVGVCSENSHACPGAMLTAN